MPPTFRTAVEAHDFDAVSELFTDDIRMRSPIARRIYRGCAAVIDVLRAVSTVSKISPTRTSSAPPRATITSCSSAREWATSRFKAATYSITATMD